MGLCARGKAQATPGVRTAMSDLERLSFTIEKSLLRRMNRLMKKAGCGNRSEFIRDLVRSRLVEEEWKAGQEAIGTITVVFDHEKRQLSHKLTTVQHHHHDEILAATHIHLDAHMCAEMIMVRGEAALIEDLAEELRRQKGVLHVALSMSSTGKTLA